MIIDYGLDDYGKLLRTGATSVASASLKLSRENYVNILLSGSSSVFAYDRVFVRRAAGSSDGFVCSTGTPLYQCEIALVSGSKKIVDLSQYEQRGGFVNATIIANNKHLSGVVESFGLIRVETGGALSSYYGLRIQSISESPLSESWVEVVDESMTDMSVEVSVVDGLKRTSVVANKSRFENIRLEGLTQQMNTASYGENSIIYNAEMTTTVTFADCKLKETDSDVELMAKLCSGSKFVDVGFIDYRVFLTPSRYDFAIGQVAVMSDAQLIKPIYKVLPKDGSIRRNNGLFYVNFSGNLK